MHFVAFVFLHLCCTDEFLSQGDYYCKINAKFLLHSHSTLISLCHLESLLLKSCAGYSTHRYIQNVLNLQLLNKFVLNYSDCSYFSVVTDLHVHVFE